MFASIIAALGMCADGVAEGLYAARHRFSTRAAGAGYVMGAGLAWFYGAVTPITFTVESITIATKTAKKRPQILYIVVLSAVPSIVLGLFGLYSRLIALLSTAVIGGVIGGVGIILAQVGAGYIGNKPATAGSSTLAGVIAYLFTEDLVAVIVAAMVAGTLVGRFVPARFRPGEGDDEGPEGDSEPEGDASDGDANEGDRGEDTRSDGGEVEEGSDEAAEDGEERGRFGLLPLEWGRIFSFPVVLGAFSVFALRTGAVVSYATVNADLAGRDPALDGATLMAGLGSLASALVGGPPIETTPAPMAAAPQPVFSTVLFMALMIGIAFFGLIGRIGEYVPLQAIAGFLIVLGVLVILPEQLPRALEEPLPGAAALAVTVLSGNPFYGILVGEAMVLILSLGVVGVGGG